MNRNEYCRSHASVSVMLRLHYRDSALQNSPRCRASVPHSASRRPQKAPAAGPVPTEHYRSYRRVAPPAPPVAPPPGPDDAARARRLPKPINYIHASNPNLLDFDKSDFVTKPTLHVPKPKPKAG